MGRSSLSTHPLAQCSKVAGWAAAASTHTFSHNAARWQGGPQQPQHTPSRTKKQGGRVGRSSLNKHAAHARHTTHSSIRCLPPPHTHFCRPPTRGWEGRARVPVWSGPCGVLRWPIPYVACAPPPHSLRPNRRALSEPFTCRSDAITNEAQMPSLMRLNMPNPTLPLTNFRAPTLTPLPCRAARARALGIEVGPGLA